MAVLWLVVGVVLLLVEMRHMAFFALFVAVGSFAAALVALVAPSAIPLQVVTAVAVSIGGVAAGRPALRRAFPRHIGGRVALGVHGGIVGQEAITLDEVGPPHRRGHVRLAGERWLAASTSGTPIPADTPVVVTAVEGTTLLVWPLQDLSPGPILGAEAKGNEPEGLPPDESDGRAK